MSKFQEYLAELEALINKAEGDTSNLTEQEAESLVGALVSKMEGIGSWIEGALVPVAVEHGIEVSLGSYGTGRSLILEDGHWTGKPVGDWVFSSENC